MTYKEKYQALDTWEQIKEAMETDITVALAMGSSDRVKVIKEIGEEVCRDKGILSKEEEE